MLKLTTYFLSFTILIQSFDFEMNDISKFSILADHISEHLDKGDNFVDFIDLHYGNKVKSHQNQDKEHKNLPFKHQHIDFQSQLVYVINTFHINIPLIENSFMVNNFNYKELTSNLYINRFFQPPQK
jgi:hypothetical protein